MMHALKRIGRIAVSPCGSLACVLALWACTVAGRVWTPWVLMDSDTAYYLALGRSLAQGEGYRIHGLAHRAYPPVFPAMLAAVHSPSRADYRPEKLVVAASSLGALLCSWWLFSQRARGARRLVLGLLLALCPVFVRMTGFVMTDVPCLLFVVAFVAAASRFWREERGGWAFGVLSMVALALAALTRLAALFFYFGVAAWLLRPSLWRRSARRCVAFGLLFVGIALPPVVAWGAWVASSGEKGTDTYSDYVRDDVLEGRSPWSAGGVWRLMVRETKTVYEQLRSAGRAVAGDGLGVGRSGWVLSALAIAVVGFVARRRDAGPQEYFAGAYGLLMALWPSPQGYRLWLPVVPFMLGYLVEGGELVARSVAKRVRPGDAGQRRLRAGLLSFGGCALLVGFVAADVRYVRLSWRPPAWVVSNVALGEAQGDVAQFCLEVQGRSAAVAYVRWVELVPALRDVETRVVYLPHVGGMDSGAALRAIREKGITHLALGEEPEGMGFRARPEESAKALVAALPVAFRAVKRTRAVAIYEVLPAREED